MIQNGANFAAVKGAANNQVVSNETCVVCHSAGAVADVQVVHNLAVYQ
jgi:cytochrome c5